jgi:sugar lactone lactonase YvrE
MRRGFVLSLMLVFGTAIGSVTWAAKPGQFPQNTTFTTKALTPFAIEGLTMDATGNFYTTGRQPDTNKKCPVWRIKSTNGSRVTVGFIQNPPCNPSGITFDSIGNLYISDAASGGIVWQVSPDPIGCASDDSSNPACSAIPNGTHYATGVPGTNGLAFDRGGNLWTADGTTGQGRVWKITGSGANCSSSPPVNCEEVFRVQPLANEVNLDPNGVGGVGRDLRTLPPGTITVTPTSRNAANTAGSQPLVGNGVAFNHEGHLFVADTARGAIWRAEFNEDGTLKSRTNCDTTFTSNTLCLDNIFVTHPILEGADGIALDVAGNIWVDANERNAVGVVTKDGTVVEIFRNPVNAAGLRNSADMAVGNNHILELPSSPFLLGKKLCTSNSDGNRRDNSPNTVGEIMPSGPNRGKISCMDQDLKIPGMRLPIE